MLELAPSDLMLERSHRRCISNPALRDARHRIHYPVVGQAVTGESEAVSRHLCGIGTRTVIATGRVAELPEGVEVASHAALVGDSGEGAEEVWVANAAREREGWAMLMPGAAGAMMIACGCFSSVSAVTLP